MSLTQHERDKTGKNVERLVKSLKRANGIVEDLSREINFGPDVEGPEHEEAFSAVQDIERLLYVAVNRLAPAVDFYLGKDYLY